MKKLKALDLSSEEFDALWDEVKVMMDAADSCYAEMLLDLDEGNKLDPEKRKALTDRLDKLRHKLEVFRNETDV